MLKLVGNKCQVGSYFDQITLIIYFDVNLQNSLFKRLSNERACYLITRDRMTVRYWCFPGYLYSVSPSRNMLYISWRTCCLKREDHAYHVGFLRLNLRRHCDFTIGRASTTATSTRTPKKHQLRQTKHQFCTYITLFCTIHFFLPKTPNLTFCRGREHKKATFFFFS